MANVDPRIQKIVVPTNRLPYSTSDGFYYIRYRIVTQGNTPISSWSPKYQVRVVSVSDIVTDDYKPNYKLIFDSRAMNLTWDVSDKLALDTFDVYVKWSNKDFDWDRLDWTYVSTTQANSVAIPIPTTAVVENIIDVVYTSTTARYTCASQHNLEVGESVTISGIAPAGYSGTFTITAINPTEKTFTVDNTTNLPITNALGTVSVVPEYAKFWVQAPTQSKEVSEPALLFVAPFVTKPSNEADFGIFLNTVLNVDGGSPDEL